MKRLKKSTANKNWVECIFPLIEISPGSIFVTNWDKRFDKESWEDPSPVSVLLDDTLVGDTLVIQYIVTVKNGYHFFEVNSKQEEFLGKLEKAIERYKEDKRFESISYDYATNILRGSDERTFSWSCDNDELEITDEGGSVILYYQRCRSLNMVPGGCDALETRKTLANLFIDTLCSGESLNLTVTIFIQGNKDWKMSYYLMRYFYNVNPVVSGGYTWISVEDMEKTIAGRYWCLIPGKYKARTNSSLTVVPKELMCSKIKYKAPYKKILIDFANGDSNYYDDDLVIWILTRYWDD